VKTLADNPRKTTGPHRRRGVLRAFTLIELLATLIIVSTVAAVASPIVLTATDAYAKSAKQRRSAERAAAALDRLSRILREAPAKATPAGATDFKAADSSSFGLVGGTGVALTGSTVTLETSGVPATPLCPDVTAFEITYLDSSGVAVNVALGTDAVRRVVIRLAAGGTELSTSVWLRASLNE
jgi:prepilin-type N-terminal cleavage/methylation domain-containing protein